jgi:hypothetical protein
MAAVSPFRHVGKPLNLIQAFNRFLKCPFRGLCSDILKLDRIIDEQRKMPKGTRIKKGLEPKNKNEKRKRLAQTRPQTRRPKVRTKAG